MPLGATFMDYPEPVRALLAAYSSYESTLPMREATDRTAQLAVFNGSKTAPIHRWFPFKEGFSHELLEWAVSAIGLDVQKCGQILDPFCGVGTSLLAAQLALKAPNETLLVGVERNPFIKFVAHAKLNWFSYNVERIKSLLPKLLLPLGHSEIGQSEVPGLTTIRNPAVFSRATVEQLIGYRDRIQRELKGTAERDFFLLGWSATIEKVSGVRRDGRALRFVDKSEVPTVAEALEEQWGSMVTDLETTRSRYRSRARPARFVVVEGDGRGLHIPNLENESVDLVVYSPPYLNNIDYTEVYKLELWMSGHVDNSQEFLELRRKTFRSHPSVRFPTTAVLDKFPTWQAHALRARLLESVPRDKNCDWRHRLFEGYIDDMLTSLTREHEVCKPGAFVICVVGNSMHARKAHPIIIATDLIVASLAQLVGFELVQLQVTRQLRRRDHASQFLRETILVLRKPA
jgi:hypothetical protein